MKSNFLFKKCINLMNSKGQKHKGFLILIEVFFLLKKKHQCNPLSLFISAVSKTSPVLGVRKLKSKNKTSFIPKLISSRKRQIIGLKWLLESAIQQTNQTKNFKDNLAKEIFLASINKGLSSEKKKKFYNLLERENIIL